MQRSRMLSAILASCALILSLGCVGMDRPRVVGSGVAQSEQRAVDPFDQISIDGAVDARVTIGPQQDLTIQGDDNILPLIKTEVKGGKLVISSEQPYSTKIGVRVVATVPKLRGVSIAGSGDVSVEGLDADRFAVAIAGSGDVTASGSAQSVSVSINGSGNVKLGKLQAQTGKVSIAGSGDVTINTSEALDVSVAGSGDVKYVGSPKITKSVAGSGNVRKVG